MKRQTNSLLFARLRVGKLLPALLQTIHPVLATGVATLLAVVPPAVATPVAHAIAAANVTVVQNDINNNATSVTCSANLAINGFRMLDGTGSGNSRADYFVQIGASAAGNVTNGILLSSITDNGRDNGEGNGINYGTSAVDSGASATPGSSGQWWVPVFGSPTMTSATFPEYNFDFAAAYFPYNNGWYGGWLVNKGGTNNAVGTVLANDRWIGNTNMILGTHVLPLGGGKVTVDLRSFGLDCRSNALLLCCGGKNEENFASCQTNADGTWTVTTRDDISGSAEADPNAFVCVPLTNHTVISGRFMGNGAIANKSAPFFVTNTYVGTYHLVLPGITPGHGVLIISGEAGGTYNSDNMVSYQATADGWDIQTRDTGSTATAAGPNLQNLPAGDAVVSFVYIPAPTPGFTVTPTNGLLTSESGAAATFSVVLDAPPKADVTISVGSSQTALALTSTNSLTFTANNWNVPQSVVVTGVTNTLVGAGIQPYTVNLGAAVSADTNYNGFQPPVVNLGNVNDNTAGISVWPTNGLVTSESGGTATFYLVLNSQPAADVTVGMASGNASEGTTAPSALTFTANNWNTPQAVTITGVDDAKVDGNVAFTVLTAPAISADANYNNFKPADVSVINLDNEVAGVNMSVGPSIAVIEGGTTNFALALSAQPVSSVTITINSGNPSVGTVAPSAVTFTANNWNIPQMVTLSGVDNSVNAGSVSYPLLFTVVSSNPGYIALTLSNLTATTLLKTAILLNSNQCVYGLGMAPVGVDGQALVLETAATNFNGASLTVTVATNAQAADSLSLRNDGMNPGQVGTAAGIITYGGAAMGGYTGGLSGTALVLTFSNGVGIDAVQAALRAVTFSTTAKSYAVRAVRFTLNDGLGGLISAVKSLRVGQLRVMGFQDGVDYGYGTYNGQADIELNQLNGSTAYPAGDNPASGLFVDAPVSGTPNEDQVLLRFDDLIGTNANQIPLGATIVSAELTLNVLNSGNGGVFNRMLIPWDATNSVWNSFADSYGDYGVYADDLTARSAFDSQLGVSVADPNTGAISGGTTGTGSASISVTPDIQAWANGDANFGWVIRGWTQETDGFGFSPSEDTVVAHRPRLVVYWVPASTAVVGFRSGVNDYTNAFDTNIRQANGDTNYATEVTLWSDANDVGQPDQTDALLQFGNVTGGDPGQIPAGAHVEIAVLDLASVNNAAAMGNGGQIFALLQPWQDTNTTWNSWGVNGIQNDGVQAALVPTAVAGTAALTSKYQGGFHTFEVTSDVQQWVNGTLANNGWAIIPWAGGSDGWGIDSAEDTVTNNRPQLRVYYSLDASAPPVIKGLNVVMGLVQVRFSGNPSTTYSVWRTDHLGGTWTAIGTIMTGTDGNAIYPDDAPLKSAGYYRISN